MPGYELLQSSADRMGRSRHCRLNGLNTTKEEGVMELGQSMATIFDVTYEIPLMHIRLD
jgi:hypothetical protein